MADALDLVVEVQVFEELVGAELIDLDDVLLLLDSAHRSGPTLVSLLAVLRRTRR